MNENKLNVVKAYEFDNPLITEIDSIIDKCYRDCHNNLFHNFINECIYDIKFTNITNIEIYFLTISGKNMGLFELKKIECC